MPSPELIGNHKRWIWPFELLERIGEGGMGEVYRARFVKNDRVVALKLLPKDVSNETILARFEREMKILRSLRHPNIVHCFGGACEGEEQFYAMELVEGGALSDLLRKQGRISVDRTIEYAKQMCSALMYAHERGVIHRDVKPGNFLLTPDGNLKLSDFGLATIAAGRKITADDRTVGTFLYMAPEQITGKPPTSPQTDLYALGCVLFELMSGSTPFRGDTSGEVLHKHLSEPAPQLASLVMSCPAEIDQLVARLLEKKPEARPSSAIEVAAALKNCGNSITVIERRPSLITPKTKEPKPVVAATVEIEQESVNPPTGRIARWLPYVLALLLIFLFAWNRWLAGSAAAFHRVETTLLNAYRGDDRQSRLVVIPLLGEIAGDSAMAFDALMDGLENKDPAIRKSAADALGNAGTAGKPARFVLKRMRKLDDRDEVRYAAREALEKIAAAPSDTRWWLWIVGSIAAGAVGIYLWLHRRIRGVAALANGS